MRKMNEVNAFKENNVKVNGIKRPDGTISPDTCFGYSPFLVSLGKKGIKFFVMLNKFSKTKKEIYLLPSLSICRYKQIEDGSVFSGPFYGGLRIAVSFLIFEVSLFIEWE